MNIEEYLGKICPYCKSEFKEGDDIVICSDCGASLHKECWDANRACTTFDCQGVVSGVWHINMLGGKDRGSEDFLVNAMVQVEQERDSSSDKFASKSHSGFKPQVRNDKLEVMSQPDAAPQPQPQVQPQVQPAPQQTKICYHCGGTVPADKAFCIHCGNNMNATPAPTNTKICYHCGATVPADKAFCISCGNEMNPVHQPAPQQYQPPVQTQFAGQGNSQPQFYQPQNNQPAQNQNQPSLQEQIQSQLRNQFQASSNASTGELYSMVEKNTEYYMPRFDKLQDGKIVSWNWAAALLGAYWLFYRKMYVYGAAYLGISLVFSWMGQFGNFLSILLAVALGATGNWLYMNHLNKVIEKAKAEPHNAEKLRNQHRGASYGIAVAVAIAWFVLLQIMVNF